MKRAELSYPPSINDICCHWLLHTNPTYDINVWTLSDMIDKCFQIIQDNLKSVHFPSNNLNKIDA